MFRHKNSVLTEVVQLKHELEYQRNKQLSYHTHTLCALEPFAMDAIFYFLNMLVCICISHVPIVLLFLLVLSSYQLATHL